MKYQPNRYGPRRPGCRWTRPQRRPPDVRPGMPQGAAVPASQAHEPPVRRYIHPIRTVSPAGTAPEQAADPLSEIRETLERHSRLLDELLRRQGSDNSDTR